MGNNNLWRINLKPNANEGIDPRSFCIEKGIIGVGWSVDIENDCSFGEYVEKGNDKYYYKEGTKEVKVGGKGWWKAINAIYHTMQIDDLCWTRDQSGIYYLGRIEGEWKYKSSKENMENDIVNTRKCEWIEIGTVDAVPGKVVNSFIARSTLQRVNDETALEYSKLLFNNFSTEYKYDDINIPKDIFSLLSVDDCENVVGLYLQKELNYLIIPKTNKLDTVKYEFVLKHRKTGEKAVVQVKNGDVNLDTSEFKDIVSKAFLFTSKGEYKGCKEENVICLNKELIEKFIYDNEEIMPDLVQVWIKFIKER